MIIYVDLEHARLDKHNPTLWEFYLTTLLATKYRLETLAGQPCLLVRYDRFSPEMIGELNVQAVIVSGHHTLPHYYAEADLTGLRSLYRHAHCPTLAFCGGFQLMAGTFGATVAPMVEDPDDPAAVYPETPDPPGLFSPLDSRPMQDAYQERGFLPVRLLQPSPLFEGLDRQPVFFQLHSWEAKALPEGFVHLADSPVCRMQAIAHQQRPMFGAQFHPEQYDDDHPHGRRLLENFFRLSRKTNDE